MSGDTPNWTSWASAVVTAAVAALGAGWWLIRRVMMGVTRGEFIAAIDSRHAENRQDIQDLREKLQGIETDVSYLRGRYERSL